MVLLGPQSFRAAESEVHNLCIRLAEFHPVVLSLDSATVCECSGKPWNIDTLNRIGTEIILPLSRLVIQMMSAFLSSKFVEPESCT